MPDGDTLGAHEGAGPVAPVALHHKFGLIGISALSSEEALWFCRTTLLEVSKVSTDDGKRC